jgi:hypothetical protein
MKYDKQLIEKLVKELVDLWGECMIRSERIEELAKQLDIQKKR